MTSFARILTFATAFGAIVALSGCSLKMNDLDGEILTDYSPEWETMTVNSEQRVYRTVETIDTNFRQLHDDVDRVLLLDRPTRLSRIPIP